MMILADFQGARNHYVLVSATMFDGALQAKGTVSQKTAKTKMQKWIKSTNVVLDMAASPQG